MTMFPTPPIPSSHESRPSRFAGLRAGPLGKTVAGVAALVLVAVAIGTIVGMATRETLRFQYVAVAGEDMMNQQLLIDYDGGSPVTPTLSFTAYDGAGHSLPKVRVRTMFGSDHGALVILPGGGFDVLIFDGPSADQVADVKVTVDDAPTVRFPLVESFVDVTPLDREGATVTRNDRIASVEVTNPNGLPVTVRLVYVVWNDPEPGKTQQAETVTPVGGLITVPGDDSVTVRMSGPADAANGKAVARNRPASIKAYFTTV
ncbi:hypothetical protein AB0J80_21520 [Actinoplanes sp. NPDC049548]|uniref:hypothetical protein n=1 Tax=Actinoplanes sp. NPDC049548 TaxID=3155152 RepID=UPI00342E40E2